VGFADAIKFDNEPEKTLEKVEELLGMCRQLVALMNASGKWQPVDTFSYQVLYDTQDGNLVWVLMDFNATEMPVLCAD
jgi:hypothetical protein